MCLSRERGTNLLSVRFYEEEKEDVCLSDDETGIIINKIDAELGIARIADRRRRWGWSGCAIDPPGF